MTRHFRLFVFFLLGFMLGSIATFAQAKGVPLSYSSLGVNRTVINGTPYVSFPSGSALGISSGVISNIPVTAQAGTATASFLANAPIAASAASVAVNLIKANPVGLVVGSVASYLLTKGISYESSTFYTTKLQGSPTPVDVYVITSGGVNYSFNTGPAACAWLNSHDTPVGKHAYAWTTNSTYPNGYCKAMQNYPFDGWGTAPPLASLCWVPDGSVVVWPVAGACTQTIVKAETVDSDWDAARSGMWPDAANLQLVKAGVALPTDKSVFAPDHVDVPMSDPYIDPLTGKRYKDIARVTPQPTTDTALVDVVRQEVDTNGQPVTSNGTPVAPTAADTDLCTKNPGIIACMQGDTPAAPDITEQDKNISITPDTGWGPDTGTCPADRVSTLHGGVQHVQSWQPTCQFLSMFRPALLAVAWFSACLIAVGIYRSYG